MTRIDVLNALIAARGYRHYLEIGVAEGDCLKAVRAPFKMGVDPAIGSLSIPRVSLFKVTSDQFFSELSASVPRTTFDLIFIDGWHSFAQSSADMDNALRFLSPGGAVVMHDANPMTEESQTDEPTTSAWHGQVWKTIVSRRHEPSLYIRTITDDCGIAVITTGTNFSQLSERIPVERMTWEGLIENRRKWLNLVSFEQFLNSLHTT